MQNKDIDARQLAFGAGRNGNVCHLVTEYDYVGYVFDIVAQTDDDAAFLTCPPGLPSGFSVYSFGKCASRVQRSEDCLLIESGKIPSQSPAKFHCNLEERTPLHGFSVASAQAQQHAPTRRQPHV